MRIGHILLLVDMRPLVIESTPIFKKVQKLHGLLGRLLVCLQIHKKQLSTNVGGYFTYCQMKYAVKCHIQIYLCQTIASLFRMEQ